MERKFLHVFSLTIDGLAGEHQFRMPYEVEDVAEATDACAKYVARQEDNFLPIGLSRTVRANRVIMVTHVGVGPFKDV